jgi:hypothetical protein
MKISANPKLDARVDPHIEAIRAILDLDLFPDEMGARLRSYCWEHLNHDEELYCAVYDRLAADKIISKTNFKELFRCTSSSQQQA